MNSFTRIINGRFPQVSLRDPAFESLLIRRFLLPLSILLSFVFLPPPASASSGLPRPSGAAHWGRAEGNAQDSIGLNPGALEGGAVYASGMAGQGFSFDGADDLLPTTPDGLPTE